MPPTPPALVPCPEASGSTMSQIEIDPAARLRQCQDAVDQLLARRAWQLIDREMFVERTFAQIRSGAVDDPARAAIHTYSRALYAACSGTQGLPQQNRGYAELFQYLYDIARRRYPDVADDAAQQAIERVFNDFEQCRGPGTFLAFAFHQLLEAARTARRQDDQGRRRAARSAGERFDDLAAWPNQQQDDPAAQAIAAELRARFERLMIEFLHKHPRATQQLTALRLKYVEGLDEAAISRELGKPTRNIYVMRARAIEKLRADPSWRALAVEFGIIPEDEV
jgi:RNA polymerase sigma factor (sigma-70 family)